MGETMTATVLGFVLTAAGIVVSISLKFSEYRFAVAREKFVRRLDAYEQLMKAAMLLASARPFKSSNSEACEQYAANLKAFRDLIVQSLPILSAPIIREAARFLTLATESLPEEASFDRLMDGAFNLSRMIRSELGTKGCLSKEDRILLGLKKMA